MHTADIDTPRLILKLESLEETRSRIEAKPDADKADLSIDWLALLAAATSADPWVLGFNMVRREDKVIVGQCGFKGPPTPDGVVEIAYGVTPAEQGKGYATEAAQALTGFAFKHEAVWLVRAHTLPLSNASTRVLCKCGYRRVGEVLDPEDGLVWRWERGKAALRVA